MTPFAFGLKEKNRLGQCIRKAPKSSTSATCGSRARNSVRCSATGMKRTEVARTQRKGQRALRRQKVPPLNPSEWSGPRSATSVPTWVRAAHSVGFSLPWLCLCYEPQRTDTYTSRTTMSVHRSVVGFVLFFAE